MHDEDVYQTVPRGRCHKVDTEGRQRYSPGLAGIVCPGLKAGQTPAAMGHFTVYTYKSMIVLMADNLYTKVRSDL